MTLSEAFGFAAGAIPNLFAMSVVISALAFALVALFFTVTHASRKANRKKGPSALGSASSPGSARGIVGSSNKKIKMRLDDDDDDDYKGSSSNSSSSFFINSGSSSSSGSGYSSSSSCGGSSDSGGGSCGGGD